jgi:predicted deacylase
VEPGIVEAAVRGVKNVLRELRMIEGEPDRPAYQAVIQKTKWIRAERGGFLQFHVQPGEILEKDQPLATNTNLLGYEKSVLYAPFDSVVLGMTTLPAVSPGEPVCHLGRLPRNLKSAKLRQLRLKEDGLEGQIVDELATNVMIHEPTEETSIESAS